MKLLILARIPTVGDSLVVSGWESSLGWGLPTGGPPRFTAILKSVWSSNVGDIWYRVQNAAIEKFRAVYLERFEKQG